MPNFKGHMCGGLAAYGIVLAALCAWRGSMPGPMVAMEWLVFTLSGAMFPDIDVKSRSQNYFYWLIILLLIVLINTGRYALLASVSVFAIMPMLVRHRGLFHRLWFVILFPLTCWSVLNLYMPRVASVLWLHTIFFIVGAISHLWLDLGWRRMLRI
ncbi:MAG: metal-dependent hydrolase [bacterium]|nr:metal-dependent hydrolase [bacterium]